MPKFIESSITKAIQSYISDQKPTDVAILVDEHTKELCLPLLSELKISKTIEVTSGEEHKQLATCSHIWEQLTSFGFDRKALLINLGGGVIGDMGGFCAASYKRGIRFINVPTTLLSMVDASVGGKLGVDFGPLKNHIGFFQLPDEVFICPIFLKTLPQNELRSGFAEVVKHALIQDSEHWKWLQQQSFPDLNWLEVIKKSVAIKEEVVKEDPTEKGLRKILNFGHTIGHAIESYFLDKDKLLHGEAIAVGMICESYVSWSKGLLSEEALKEITTLLIATYGQQKISEGAMEAIAPFMLQDKKNEGKLIQASLLKGIGNAIYDVEINKKNLLESIRHYNGLNVNML